ncbi:MAG: hypothetical protein K6A67_01260 [Bacteroidales bacterium]|nr:hypothetical protein [Bacteroidales bacterium]
MKNKLIEFASLVGLLFLLNVLSYIVGMLFVDNFETFLFSDIQVADELLLIVFFVPFLLIAIRFYKKGGIVILSIVNIFGGLLFLHNDTMDYGWEAVSTFVFTISKFNHLLSIIVDFEDWLKINVTIVWGCYIAFVGYSYVFIRQIIDELIQGKRTDCLPQQEDN